MNKGLEAQQQIFAANPDDRRAFEALEEHFFLEGDWPALVRVYRGRLAAPSLERDAAQRGALLFRLGQILEDRILDLDAACETYWALARLDRTNRPALRQLRGIHTRRRQWDMVLQIAELEGATAMPPYERAQFESDLGRIWHRELGDRNEAERAYRRALAASADFAPALEGMASLLLEADRPEEAAHALERLTTCLRGPERAPFWLALGRLYTDALGDRPHARRCFAAALEDDPLLTAAVEWSLLLATEAEDWPNVIELLEHRFDLASGARHRASIAVEASQIHLHHCGSAAGARAWVERATELAEEDGAVLRARADVERMEGNDAALAGVLERLARKAGARAPRGLLLELAQALAGSGRPEAALDALARLGATPARGDGPVLELQARLLRETGAKRELAEVLELQVELDVDDALPLRLARRHELARLFEDDLADLAAAESGWQSAFALSPSDPESLAGLERLQRKREDWHALRTTLETALAAAEPNPDPALSTRLGALLLDRFDEPDTARGRLERALERDAYHPDALAGLHRVAQRLDDPELMLAVCEREAEHCEDPRRFGELAQRALSTLLEHQALDRALVWAVRAEERLPESRAFLEARCDLEARLGRTSDEAATLARLAPRLQGSERARRLLRRATLLLEQNDAGAAAACLEAAHASAPSRIDVLEALVECRERLGEPRDLADALRRLCALLPEARRAKPLGRLAALLEDPIGDLDAAIAARRALAGLERPPEDAVDSLARLLELAGRHAELAAVLERERARHGDGSREARELDLRRGRLLLDALGDCDAAAALFSALHEREPENDAVLELLERALRAGHDAAGLCDLLARRADWEDDASARSALQLERAELLEEVLGRAEEACDVYATVLAEGPGTDAAVRARNRLESLCEATGQWTRLRRLLEARLAAAAEPECTGLRLRLAEICRDRLQDPAGCAQQLEAVVAAHPERVDLWQQLQDLHLRVLDRPAEWLRVAQAELSSVPAPRRELVLRIAMGRLLLDAGRRPRQARLEDAIDHYERAFQLDPSHAEAAAVLARHYERVGRPDDVARVLEAHLAQLDEARIADRDALRLRLARVYLNGLADDRRARPLLEAVYAVRGALPEVAEPLADLLERSREGADAALLAQLAREVIARTPSERAQRPWRVRLARACTRAGELDEAVAAYRSLLQQGPSDPVLEDELIALYERRRERAPLIELLERRLPYASAEAALALRLRLAALHEAGPDGAARALEQLEAILDEVPHHVDALERALALTRRIDEPARTRALLDRALRLPLPAGLRADCLERRAALVASDAPDEVEQSITDLREVLALEPDRHSARRALRIRLTALERWPAVLEALAHEAASATDGEREALLEEGADLAETRLGPDAALPWLARLRAARPEDAGLWARLAALHTRAGRFEAALRALDAQASLLRAPAARLAVHLERAHLLEHALGAPGRAVLAYQAALPLASEREPVLAELDRLLARLDRPLERAIVLEERVRSLPGRDGIALRRTLAELHATALARPDRALPHLRANVAATVDRPEEELHHLGVLGTVLRATSHETDWAAVAERELELLAAHDALRRATPLDYQRFLREELARILDQRLGDPERALERLRERCDDPTLAGEAVPDRVRLGLFDLLRRTGATAELADRLTRFTATGRASGREWLELASLREVLGEFEAAFTAYRAVREATPGDEHAVDVPLAALRGRMRCAERLHDAPALALALSEALAFEPPLPRAERASLAHRLGEIAWRQLGRADEARAAYRLALELDERDGSALQAWLELAEACGERDERLALIHRALGRADREPQDRAWRAALYRRLAALHGAADDASHEAIDAWLEAERLEPLSAADEHALARLYERIGDTEAFTERFGRWCDREDAGAGVEAHLELARHLAAAGASAAALARAERAVAAHPAHAGAWAAVAEHAAELGRGDRAVEAYEHAASHASPLDTARHLVAAGELVAPLDPDRAHALFARATAADPACFEAHAALARSAQACERPEEAVHHAEQALELAEARALPPATRLALALLGGRAARRIDARDAALRLFRAAHALDAEEPEALEGLAEACFASGDLAAAKELLERRLTRTGEGPERARLLWMVGHALASEGELERAAERLREALHHDATLDAAHEALARVEERAARPDRARAALAEWARASLDARVRGRAALRAAEHALADGALDEAVQQLEWATGQDPELGEAWVLLCEVSSDRLDPAELARLCRRALDAIAPGVHSARIALRLARLAEVAGDRDEAIARHAEAWRWDPRCSEAALGESRLARRVGDWIEADAILARSIEAHPDPDSPSLAQVHLERGRLLSGPLEAFDEAILAYRRALALQPGLAVAKSALASLLLHAPDRWREALALHREILAVAPTTTASLRALGTLAAARGQTDVGVAVESLLAALGQTSSDERTLAPPTLGLTLHAGPPLANPDHERLRRLAHLVRDELARIPPDPNATLPAEPAALPTETVDVTRRILALEGELSAPALARLGPEERRTIFLSLGGLFLDPGGNGGDSRLRDALDAALGLWTRRKLRRLVEETDLEALARLDYAAFGDALRALAAATLLDREPLALRAVIVALLALDPESRDAGEPLATELGGRVASCGAAKGLLVRITTVLCEKLERGR